MASPGGKSERRLVRAAKRGSTEAIEALVQAHWDEAYRVAMGIVGDPGGAEDVAQEALLAAVRGLPRFNSRRPFRPWLQAIVTNRALDAVRHRRRRPETSLPEEDALGSAPAADAATPWLSEPLRAALLELAPEARAALVLRHVLDFSAVEIAAILDTTPGAVRSGLMRSRRQVRDRLEAAGWDPDPESEVSRP
jgi:RNA polymerase sigma-70 factor, ECF subfamily